MIALVGQFLVANHLIGTNDTSTEIFTRATYPNGFLLVIFIPLVATAVLFYGIIRKNSMQRQLMFASAEPLLLYKKRGQSVKLREIRRNTQKLLFKFLGISTYFSELSAPTV